MLAFNLSIDVAGLKSMLQHGWTLKTLRSVTEADWNKNTYHMIPLLCNGQNRQMPGVGGCGRIGWGKYSTIRLLSLLHKSENALKITELHGLIGELYDMQAIAQ